MHRKVLTVVSTLERCGPVNVLQGIVRHYDNSSYGAVIGTLSTEGLNSRIAEFEAADLETRSLKLSRLGSVLYGPSQLRELIYSVKPGLVHSHGIRPDILLSKLNIAIPCITTIHSDLNTDYQLSFGNVIGRLMTAAHFAALRKFTRVVAISEFVSQSLAEMGVASEVIPNGIDLDVYTPPRSAEEILGLRRSFAWPIDKSVILHAGNLTRGKRVLQLISSFRSSEVSARAWLIFAGNGPLRQQCHDASAGASNIIFMGKRNDVPDLMKAADVLVSNSASEGFGLSVAEGCACGMQVLATDIASHRQIAERFPDQMKLFPVGDMKALSKSLNSYEAFSIDRSTRPSRISLQALSDRNMSSKYQELYSSLLQ